MNWAWVSAASSSFRVGWRIRGGGGLISVFRGLFGSVDRVFKLAGGLGAGLSLCGVQTLS